MSSWDVIDPLADAEANGGAALYARLFIEGSRFSSGSAAQQPEGVDTLLALLSLNSASRRAPQQHRRQQEQPEPVSQTKPEVNDLSNDPSAVLLAKGTCGPLSATEMDLLVRGLLRSPTGPCGAGFQPGMLPRLVDVNPAVAVEVVACLLHKPAQAASWGGVGAFLQMLVPADPSTASTGNGSGGPPSSPGRGGAGKGRATETSANGAQLSNAGPALSLQLLEVVSRLLLPDAAPPSPVPVGGGAGATPGAGAGVGAAAGAGKKNGSKEAALAAASAAGIFPSSLPPTPSQAQANPSALTLSTPSHVPQDFIRTFISRALHAVSVQQDKALQARQVRLMCVFLTSLLRGAVLPTRSKLASAPSSSLAPADSWEDEAETDESAFGAVLMEVEAFAVECSKVKEAAALYRLLVSEK